MLYSRSCLVIKATPTLMIGVEYNVSFFDWLRTITSILLAASTSTECSTRALEWSHNFLYCLCWIRESLSNPAAVYKLHLCDECLTLFHDDYS